MQVRFLSGGTQNEIYEIRRGEEHCVIRIPPPGHRRTGTRESCESGGSSRRSTAQTCPTLLRSRVCSDASVLGRPFYLMGFVDGWSPMELGSTAVAGALRH